MKFIRATLPPEHKSIYYIRAPSETQSRFLFLTDSAGFLIMNSEARRPFAKARRKLMEKLEAGILGTVFRNEENGWSVLTPEFDEK